MSTDSPSTISPSDDQLVLAIKASRAETPSLGVPKLLVALLSANPTWALSDKRLRKVLQKEGLSLSTPKSVKKDVTQTEYPVSQLNEDLLDLDHWCAKIDVKYFGKEKGKGLVCKEKIEEGEILWKEDPFAYFPAEWQVPPSSIIFLKSDVLLGRNREIQSEQNTSPATRCSNCARSLPSPKSPPLSCEHGCSQRWCTRLCLMRAKNQHAFLCSTQNPACVPLLRWIGQQKWIAVGAWTKAVAYLMGEWVTGVVLGEGASWRMVRSLAALSLRERVKVLPNW